MSAELHRDVATRRSASRASPTAPRAPPTRRSTRPTSTTASPRREPASPSSPSSAPTARSPSSASARARRRCTSSPPRLSATMLRADPARRDDRRPAAQPERLDRLVDVRQGRHRSGQARPRSRARLDPQGPGDRVLRRGRRDLQLAARRLRRAAVDTHRHFYETPAHARATGRQLAKILAPTGCDNAKAPDRSAGGLRVWCLGYFSYDVKSKSSSCTGAESGAPKP